MDKLRMSFEKTGRALYISHLDLMHTLQRGFFRADYDLKYSEGFNPHPIMSIALPLSVGAASICELMDFSLKDEVDTAEMPERLTRALPEGICVKQVYVPDKKFALLKWLAVEGVFEYDSRDSAMMAEKLSEFFSREHIIISKKTKRGAGETDIKAAVKSIDFQEDEGRVKAKAVVSAQEPTLNPELLSDALRQLEPELAPDFAKFTRTETYDADMQVFR